jgi:hypothetical protein
MCILGKDKLFELIEKYKCIYPFDYNLLDGDSYVLTVKEETTLQYLDRMPNEYVCLGCTFLSTSLLLALAFL